MIHVAIISQGGVGLHGIRKKKPCPTPWTLSQCLKCRSAEGAFDLLQKFKHIQTRDSINKQLMDKFSDILGR